MFPRPNSQGEVQNMGHFSVEIYALPGSTLSANQHPAILKMPSGYLQQNPWLTIATRQLELMHRSMVELGLTPAARSRVQASSPPGPSKFAGLLGRNPWSPTQ